MGNVHNMFVFTPVVGTEEEVKLSATVRHIVGMYLVILSPRSLCPLVIKVEHMHPFAPIHEIRTYKKVAISGHTTQIILPAYFIHPASAMPGITGLVYDCASAVSTFNEKTADTRGNATEANNSRRFFILQECRFLK